MHLRLDLLGGLAGDMFIAAVLDAFPEHGDGLRTLCDRLAATFGHGNGGVRLVPFSDGVFQGRRFVVAGEDGDAAAGAHGRDADDAGEARSDRPGPEGHASGPSHAHVHPHPHPHRHEPSDDHGHAHGAAHRHLHVHRPDDGAAPRDRPFAPAVSSGAGASPAHVHWSEIRARLHDHLAPGVLRHALGIFGALAEAEAAVHGVAVDDVAFHEVGAWDSIVDIVGAAWLIDVLDARSWQVGAVPLGGGRVRTAHGPMPVPTPATALLLRGFATIDDGIAGERVTPTGAAILKHLLPDGNAGAKAAREPRVLRRAGVGFGSRRLDGISNCVRLLVFDDAAAPPAPSAHRELAVVEFEVDDQSAEDLATGLDRLRAHAAVFDVVQAPVFGKKGRMMTSVRLLARPADLDAVLDACFRETTTIGLRHTTVRGKALPRRSDEVVVDGHRLRVKTVERPGGATAKAESDDALAHETHQARRRLRHEAERLVLDGRRKGENDA